MRKLLLAIAVLVALSFPVQIAAAEDAPVQLIIPPVVFPDVPLGEIYLPGTPSDGYLGFVSNDGFRVDELVPGKISIGENAKEDDAVNLVSEPLIIEDDPDLYSFVFDNLDLTLALRLLAEQTGSNIVIHDEVSGSINLSLHDVTLQQTLDLISQAKGLSYIKQGNVYIITPGHLTPGNNQPTQAKYALQNVSPANVDPLLSSFVGNSVKFVIENASRSVVLQGPHVAVESALELLRAVDVRQKQVVLMTSVLEITEEEMTKLGLRHRDVTGNAPADPTVSLIDDVIQIFASPVRVMGTLFEIQTELDALGTSQNAKVLATPSLASLNGRTASLFLGDSIPVRRPAGEGVVDVDWVEVGINLTYTPWINDYDEVTLDIDAEVESISGWVDGEFPNIVSRNINTSVRASSGQPIVIGGLFTRNELETMSKIPVLGDLPLLGPLFRTKRTDFQESEIVMIIVPHII